MQNLIYSSALSIIGVLADCLIKKAALTTSPSMWYWLATGMLIYGSSGVGWFYVMKHMPLYAIGIVFPLVSAFSLIFAGVFFFHESISLKETAGIILGIIAIILIGWQSAA
jgi:drug/metabolite transporter (DMT)-like permease